MDSGAGDGHDVGESRGRTNLYRRKAEGHPYRLTQDVIADPALQEISSDRFADHVQRANGACEYDSPRDIPIV